MWLAFLDRHGDAMAVTIAARNINIQKNTDSLKIHKRTTVKFKSQRNDASLSL
jgi:hypothetical protein